MRRGSECGCRVSRTHVLAAIALVCLACAPERPSRIYPRLVVLYATCTLNKQFLQPYDADVDYTPHLAAFGRQSLVFPRHKTESGQSGLDFASLFSGSQADRHQVYSHPARIDSDVRAVDNTESKREP